MERAVASLGRLCLTSLDLDFADKCTQSGPTKNPIIKRLRMLNPTVPFTGQMCVPWLVWNRGAPAHAVLQVNVKQDFGDFSFHFGKREASGKSCGHCTVSPSLKGIHFRMSFKQVNKLQHGYVGVFLTSLTCFSHAIHHCHYRVFYDNGKSELNAQHSFSSKSDSSYLS